MSVTPHEELVRLLANLDQQISDASALIAELPEFSPDGEAACRWLAESHKASDRIRKLLAAFNGD